MIAIDVRADIDRAIRSLTELQRTVIPTTTARALNKTAAQAKTQAGREIRTRYNISSRIVGRHITVFRATKTGATSLTAIVRPFGRKFQVIAFQARQTPAGVRIQIKRGSPKVIAHAFIARLKSGHLGVFARGVYSGRRFVHQKPRLPITELFTVGVPQAFGNRVVIEALQRKVREKFPGILEHEIRFAITKL
jgi:Prophage minor tail protein Z (GPZ)